MLQIAIHGNHHVALGFMKTGRKSRALAKVPAQPDHLQMPVCFDQVGQQLEAAVCRSVIDEEDFVRLPARFQHGREPVVQRQQGRFLVVDGNNDR